MHTAIMKAFMFYIPFKNACPLQIPKLGPKNENRSDREYIFPNAYICTECTYCIPKTNGIPRLFEHRKHRGRATTTLLFVDLMHHFGVSLQPLIHFFRGFIFIMGFVFGVSACSSADRNHRFMEIYLAPQRTASQVQNLGPKSSLKPLTRISHGLSTAAGGSGHVYFVALRRAPRRTGEYACGALGRAPCIHVRLRRLATKSREKCGLIRL